MQKPIRKRRYQEAIEQALEALKNNTFQYNANQDPNYMQYEARQRRLAKRSAEDVLSMAQTQNGGRLHSFAMQLANQQYQEGLGEMLGKRLEFIKQARDAYNSKQATQKAYVEQLQNLDYKEQTEYEKELALWQKAEQETQEQQRLLQKQKEDMAHKQAQLQLQERKFAHAQQVQEAKQTARQSGGTRRSKKPKQNSIFAFLASTIQKYGKKK